MMNTQNNNKRVTTSIPQPILVGETMLLHRWCVIDREILVRHGLDWKMIESLPELCSTCDSLYIKFTIAKQEKVQMRKKLVQSFKSASRVRALAVKNIRYAISAVESDRKLPCYSKRKSHPAIIADLKEIASLCVHFESALSKTGFRQQQAGAIMKCAHLKEQEYLKYQKLKLDYRELKTNYLHAYKNVYNASKKIRNCAFSIFPISSERRKGYVSEYRKSFY
ncbi:MAG TPA: hypothetical protein VHO70_04495, partial [Chitinispirillaceae bacterium]|nr:hypothetical protein [Chitinispirillaceae bacterium]